MRTTPKQHDTLSSWLTGSICAGTVAAAVAPKSDAARHVVALARRLVVRTPHMRSRNLRELEGTRSNLG